MFSDRPQLQWLGLAQEEHRFQRGQDAGDMQSMAPAIAETHRPQVDAVEEKSHRKTVGYPYESSSVHQSSFFMSIKLHCVAHINMLQHIMTYLQSDAIS